MIQYNNFLMKREQSRAGSRFAECEKSRLKAKILITLALLLTAATGAWADGTVTVKELTASEITAWANDATNITAADLPGFVEATTEQAQSWDGYPTNGYAYLIYGFDNGEMKKITYSSGNAMTPSQTPKTRAGVYDDMNRSTPDRYFYVTGITGGAPAGIDLTTTDGKVWTLDKMPANNIELQVEYFAESNLFLSKDALADKANISVLNGSTAVEFDDEGKSTATVTEGNTVTAKFTGKKVLGMTVAKPAGSLATPLTLEALTAGTIKVNDPKEGMQYSLNGGAKTTMSTTTTIDVAVGDKVQFYGNGTSITKYDGTQINNSTAEVKVYGNIMSLVDEENFATATTLTADGFVFMNFFAGYDKLIDASGLLLPATKLSKNCYNYMFGGCSSLTAAPALPATTLVEGCYSSMFYGCSSLTAAYVKAANISEESSPTDGMFSSCSATGAVLHTTTASQSSWNNLGANWSVVDDWND